MSRKTNKDKDKYIPNSLIRLIILKQLALLNREKALQLSRNILELKNIRV